MTIDYQSLREAAEKATWGDWDSYKHTVAHVVMRSD